MLKKYLPKMPKVFTGDKERAEYILADGQLKITLDRNGPSIKVRTYVSKTAGFDINDPDILPVFLNCIKKGISRRTSFSQANDFPGEGNWSSAGWGIDIASFDPTVRFQALGRVLNELKDIFLTTDKLAEALDDIRKPQQAPAETSGTDNTSEHTILSKAQKWTKKTEEFADVIREHLPIGSTVTEESLAALATALAHGQAKPHTPNR